MEIPTSDRAPDSRFVYFTSDRDGRRVVYRTPLNLIKMKQEKEP